MAVCGWIRTRNLYNQSYRDRKALQVLSDSWNIVNRSAVFISDKIACWYIGLFERITNLHIAKAPIIKILYRLLLIGKDTLQRYPVLFHVPGVFNHWSGIASIIENKKRQKIFRKRLISRHSINTQQFIRNAINQID